MTSGNQEVVERKERKLKAKLGTKLGNALRRANEEILEKGSLSTGTQEKLALHSDRCLRAGVCLHLIGEAQALARGFLE